MFIGPVDVNSLMYFIFVHTHTFRYSPLWVSL